MGAFVFDVFPFHFHWVHLTCRKTFWFCNNRHHRLTRAPPLWAWMGETSPGTRLEQAPLKWEPPPGTRLEQAPPQPPAGGEAGRIADSFKHLIKKRLASVFASEEDEEEGDKKEDGEEDDEMPKTKTATKGQTATKTKAKAAAITSTKATTHVQSARNKALAQSKSAVMKMRGFIPKALAPAASDNQRDSR